MNMEDGFPLFDPNNEAARQEERLKEYYNEFSANARKRLLAKTIIRPNTVYDILYPATRKALLSKNVPIVTDLEEDAKLIRDNLISKLVTEETDLEKISDDFRKSLLARQKIQEDRDNLLRNGERFRKNMIAKNSPNESNLEKDSSQVRRDSLSKNAPNPSTKDGVDKNSDSYRENSLAKNVPSESDLLIDSDAYRNQFRKNDIHKNVPIGVDLERQAERFRKNNLAKNTTKPQDIDDLANQKRQDSLAKNAPKETDLENESESRRNSSLAKNSSKDQDLLRDSESFRNQYRENDVHKNVDIETDLDRDSAPFRRNNLSNNASNSTDLEADSVPFRKDDLSHNAPKETDLENESEQFRIDDLSKNTAKTTDLESDSTSFRKDDLSNNSPKETNLEVDSEPFRKDDLSKNKPFTTDLEADSAPFRKGDLSKNKPSETDLENDSVDFRKDDLSFNKPSESDLEIDSVPFRKDDLSKNKSFTTDLESDSTEFRKDDLSFNKPNATDLEADSVPFRTDDLSKNKSIDTDLEEDSVLFREDDLSFNSPNDTDLEIDSVPYRISDLSANVPIDTDLEVDSVPFRIDDLSANVPSDSDLADDSVPFREDDLSANVPSFSDLNTDSVPFREDDLAANVPSDSDLSADSKGFREDDLAANVPNGSNLLSDSDTNREDNLAANVPSLSDLLSDSTQAREDAIAKNAGFGLLGVNVDGLGTSAFLGISRVFTQGILVRQLLLSKNKPKGTNLLTDSEPYFESMQAPNKWQLGANEYTSESNNFELGKIMQGSINTPVVDYTAIDPYYTPTAKAIFGTDDYIINKGRKLQTLYGISQTVDFPTGRKEYRISDALFSTDEKNPKGGSFTESFFVRQTYLPYRDGDVTKAIREYNQTRNPYNINGYQAGSPNSLNILEGIAEEGFQDLIQRTIGSFSKEFQTGTNTTPAGIIAANGGAYYNGGNRDTDILRPGAEDAEIGTAQSMMAKTLPGNPFEDENFLAGNRGVKHIINTIKSDEDLTSIRRNFDPQNNRAYIVGTNRDGSPRVSRQRYSIENSYAPQGAGKLVFFIKNYASNQQFFFPPYIQSIQNTENANWNSTNFLGRPEAIYTYNNSSRDASISFYVLTDYAESVDIGRDYSVDGAPRVTATFDKHFTQSDKTQNDQRRLEMEKLAEMKQEKVQSVSEINDKLDQNNAEQVTLEVDRGVVDPAADDSSGSLGDKINNSVKAKKVNENALQRKKDKEKRDLVNEESELRMRKDQLQTEIANTESRFGEVDNDFNRATNYSEASDIASNIYNVNVIKKEYQNGEVVCKPEDTIVRIDTMKQGLMFQPAYFSGDKVDFVRKIEFLSKLTRPAAAGGGESGTGFSFTKPPVCHIHLGDWWNHDIIVNSVSFDYAEAPWTLDEGRVQPMWALVTINFNIVGPFQSFSARPPLATDEGGMFSPTTRR